MGKTLKLQLLNGCKLFGGVSFPQDQWIKELFTFADNDKTFEPNKKDKFDRTVLEAYLWGLDLTQALSEENK